MQDDGLKPATTYPAIVGGILAQLRNQQGFHQGQLAEAMGVTQSTLSRIENGQSSLSIERLRLAAHSLNQAPSTILQYADNTESEMNFRGVVVSPVRNNDEFNKTLVLIGALALAAAIGVAMLHKK